MNQVIFIILCIISFQISTFAQSEIPESDKESKGKSKERNKAKDGESLEVTLNTYLASDQLTITSQRRLDKILRILPQFPDMRIKIESHTGLYNFQEKRPETGEESKARSERIADLVRDYLVNKGVNIDMIEASGFGNTQPKAILDQKGKNVNVEESAYTHINNERIMIKLSPQFDEDIEVLGTALQTANIAYQSEDHHKKK